MRLVLPVLVAGALLSGCAATSETRAPRPLNQREKIATTCGNLRARLDGISGSTADGRDPEISALGNRSTIRRLALASEEAVAALRINNLELERLAAPIGVQNPVSDAISSYTNFARTLPSHPLTRTSAVHLMLRYERLELPVLRACAGMQP